MAHPQGLHTTSCAWRHKLNLHGPPKALPYIGKGTHPSRNQWERASWVGRGCKLPHERLWIARTAHNPEPPIARRCASERSNLEGPNFDNG